MPQNSTVISIDDGNYNWTGGTNTDFIPYSGDFNVGAFGIIVAAVLAIILIFVVYWLYMKWTKNKLVTIQKQHFSLEAFLADTVMTRLAKYNQMFIVILIGIIIIMFAPPIGMNALTSNVIIRGIGAASGWTLGAFGLYIYYILVQKQELENNLNSTWLDVEIHIPGRTSVRRLWRRTEKLDAVKINEQQIEQCVTQVKNLVELNPALKKKVETMAKFVGKGKKRRATGIDVYELVRKKMKNANTYKISVDKAWPVLLIMDDTWEDAMRLRREEVFDETTTVNILRSRADVFFMNETKMMFDDNDERGLPVKNELATGIFVVTFTDKVAEESILGAGFNTPDALFALIGELKHLFQQNTITAESHNRKVSEVSRLKKELEKERNKNETSGQDEFNVLQRGWKRLFNPMTIKDSIGYIIITFFLAMFFTYWMLTAAGWSPPPPQESAEQLFRSIVGGLLS